MSTLTDQAKKDKTLEDKIKSALITGDLHQTLTDNVELFDGKPLFVATVAELTSMVVKKYPSMVSKKLANPRFGMSRFKCINQIKAEISAIVSKSTDDNLCRITYCEPGVVNLITYTPLGEPNQYDASVDFVFDEMYESNERAKERAKELVEMNA